MTLYNLADTLATTDLPEPTIELRFHDCDTEALRRIVAAFPDVEWEAVCHLGTDWIKADLGGGVKVYAFEAKGAVPVTVPRLAGLLAEATA